VVKTFGVCVFSRLAVTNWRLRRWRLWFLAVMTATQVNNTKTLKNASFESVLILIKFSFTDKVVFLQSNFEVIRSKSLSESGGLWKTISPMGSRIKFGRLENRPLFAKAFRGSGV